MKDYPFLSLENCYWRRGKWFGLHLKTELGEDKSNKNKSATPVGGHLCRGLERDYNYSAAEINLMCKKQEK